MRPPALANERDTAICTRIHLAQRQRGGLGARGSRGRERERDGGSGRGEGLLTIVFDRTKERWTPRPRCCPEQSKQMKIPYLHGSDRVMSAATIGEFNCWPSYGPTPSVDHRTTKTFPTRIKRICGESETKFIEAGRTYVGEAHEGLCAPHSKHWLLPC